MELPSWKNCRFSWSRSFKRTRSSRFISPLTCCLMIVVSAFVQYRTLHIALLTNRCFISSHYLFTCAHSRATVRANSFAMLAGSTLSSFNLSSAVLCVLLRDVLLSMIDPTYRLGNFSLYLSSRTQCTDIGVSYDSLNIFFSSPIKRIMTKTSSSAKCVLKCFVSRDGVLLTRHFLYIC